MKAAESSYLLCENLKIDINKVYEFVSKNDIDTLKNRAELANKALHEKTGKGNDFLGWVNLPSSITNEQITEIKQTAQLIQSKVEVVVVMGIGGSYLGAKAVVEALSDERTTVEDPFLESTKMGQPSERFVAWQKRRLDEMAEG